VRTLARDPDKARDRLGSDSRLEIITGDLGTPADLEAAFQGADAAYVALGSAWRGTSGASRSWRPGPAAMPQLVWLWPGGQERGVQAQADVPMSRWGTMPRS